MWVPNARRQVNHPKQSFLFKSCWPHRICKIISPLSLVRHPCRLLFSHQFEQIFLLRLPLRSTKGLGYFNLHGHCLLCKCRKDRNLATHRWFLSQIHFKPVSFHLCHPILLLQDSFFAHCKFSPFLTHCPKSQNLRKILFQHWSLSRFSPVF